MMIPDIYEQRIAELERRLAALELKPVDVEIQTASFRAQEGQHCIIEAPPAGLTVTLPHARAQNRNKRITFTLRNNNPVRFIAVDSKVNSRSSGVMNLPGTFDAVSDGLTGWGISALSGGPSSTGSSALPWNQVLAAGNNTLGQKPNIDTGDYLGFGVEGSLPVSGDIRASGNFQIHPAGYLHLNGNQLFIYSGGNPQALIDTDGTWYLFNGTSFNGGTAGQYLRSSAAGARPTWASIAFAELPSIVADTFLGNVGAAPATPVAVSLSSLAGNGLGFASHTLSVNVGVSLVISADNVVRAALTGAVTASQDSNTTAFGELAAKSVLANPINASAIPFAVAGSASFQHLRVNSANTGLEWSVLTTGDFPANSVPLTALATQAADTFVGNITALTATPIAVPLASIDSASLIYDATSHTFQLAAGTGVVTWSQNSTTTAFAAASAMRVLGNATNAPATPTYFGPSGALQYLRSNAANNALEWGTLPAPTWATVLAAGNSSGGHNPTLTAGDALIIGTDNVAAAQIRGTGSLTVQMDGGYTFNSAGGFASVLGSPFSMSATAFTFTSSLLKNVRFGGSGSGLQLVRVASPVEAPDAQTGLIWCKTQNGVSVPMWRDINTTSPFTQLDWPMASTGAVVATATATVSGATTVQASTPTLGLPANSLQVGSKFRTVFTYTFVRGATATALNLNSFFDVNNGVTGLSVAFAAPTTAGTYFVRVEGEWTVTALGTTGTYMGHITVTCSTASSVSGTLIVAQAAATATTLNTTVVANTRGACQMNAAVVGCSIATTGGHIERVN